jgi:hypothetical protein
VLSCRTCPGDRSCTECDALALDTSHLTFLARAATRLERADLGRAEILFRLVQVTACWRPDRLVTADAVYEHEINPHGDGSRVLEVLGVGRIEEGADWSTLLGRAAGERADELTIAAARVHGDSKMDCALLGHSLAEADRRSVHLVTNDEDLLVSARRLLEHLRVTDRGPSDDFMASNSIDQMVWLLRCGAIDMDVMEGALLAEFDHVSEREMSTRKKEKKLDRLRGVARQIHIGLPDLDRPFDDSDLFAEFLGKVDEHGP